MSRTSIGVRYPPSIWHLPLLAHEVGHLVALELRDDAHKVPRFPVLELAGSGSVLGWSHSLELFADAFGAYVLGPAYALTCLLLEFDPLLADDTAQDEAHPSFNRRFAALAVGLGRLEHPGVRAVGGRVLDEWARLVDDVGGPVPPSDHGDDTLVADIDSVIATYLPGRAYPGWTEASRLATTMLAGMPAQKVLSPTTTTLPDVLNPPGTCAGFIGTRRTPRRPRRASSPSY